ncbi:PAS domain-containing protein [Tistlia consotensis]|uniref:PAS domain-containing protein n=1 Tax=Tistlia consotensis USBA 355 TaxID=560819 RepID=A0A1Y6B9N2_9PROT|nr:PAS domain-containing protein [Tistlia consotensis]SMF00184.1 PAS domain-containing protein [Tistlia consotensis USBA 355]SNR76167.1 PAS domain-containing protein [Tistlia consotensis]
MTYFLYSDFYLADLGARDPPTLHPRFAEMAAYLARVAPRGRLPGRQHVDPCDLRRVIGLLNLVQVEREGTALRFRFRLIGERQRLAAGRNIAGRLVEDAVLPDLVPRIIANMTKVVTARRAVYDRFPMPHEGREFIDSERMYFPLAADGETVDVILILNGYPEAEQGLGVPAAYAAAVQRR